MTVVNLDTLQSSDQALSSDSLRSHLLQEPEILQFGTSGRRGLLVHLSQLEVYINALAELEYLQMLPQTEGGIVRGEEFFFAYDLRPSSSRFVEGEPMRGELAQAIVQAIRDAGMKPVNLGCIPTPALTCYALSRGKGSMMVTGSHIPFNRNGYKTNTSKGELLKQHEAPINEKVRVLRARICAQPFADSPFDECGLFKTGHVELPAESHAGADAYISRYEDFFGAGALSGLSLLVYQHSAVGRDLLVDILRRLGAKVIAAGRSETFVPIDTENIDQEQLATIQSLFDAAMAEHGMIDAVVSTDGDSDRPLILGVEAPENWNPLPPGEGRVRAEAPDVPTRQSQSRGAQAHSRGESGLMQPASTLTSTFSPRERGATPRARFFGGDLVGMITAEFLGADAAVVPISCNDGIDRGALKAMTEPKTRIGSPYVIAGMEVACAHGKRAVCGWEANGGFLTGSEILRNGRTLTALPTRDAMLPIISVLCAARERNLSLIELFDRLPRRFSRAALLKQFPRSRGLEIIRLFSPADGDIGEARFSSDGVALSYRNGTSGEAAEGASRQLERIRRELAGYFTDESGFGTITALNFIDGVRVLFENGDVAHLRPSGNADELRVYAVADTQERADTIAAIAVREPDGILRQMEKALAG